MTGPTLCRHALASLAAAALLALAACDGAGPNAPGAVSKGEAQALEEAAEMLDQQRSLPPETIPALDLPHDAANTGRSDDTAP
jgi:hypothetical protein